MERTEREEGPRSRIAKETGTRPTPEPVQCHRPTPRPPWGPHPDFLKSLCRWGVDGPKHMWSPQITQDVREVVADAASFSGLDVVGPAGACGPRGHTAWTWPLFGWLSQWAGAAHTREGHAASRPEGPWASRPFPGCRQDHGSSSAFEGVSPRAPTLDPWELHGSRKPLSANRVYFPPQTDKRLTGECRVAAAPRSLVLPARAPVSSAGQSRVMTMEVSELNHDAGPESRRTPRE